MRIKNPGKIAVVALEHEPPRADGHPLVITDIKWVWTHPGEQLYWGWEELAAVLRDECIRERARLN